MNYKNLCKILIERIRILQNSQGKYTKECAVCGIKFKCHNKRAKYCQKCKYKLHQGTFLQKNRLRHLWYTIKGRCYTSECKDLKKYYRDRGIEVCSEWRSNFSKFKEWALKNGYKEGLQLHRINNYGNYEPENCIFLTKKEHSRITFRR